MTRMLRTAATAVVALVALAGCSSSHPKTPAGAAGSDGAVQVSTSHCGLGWTDPKVGHQDIEVRNTDINPGEVYLTNTRTGAVSAAVDDLGPGSEADMSVDLTGGSYAFRCVIQDQAAVMGPTVTLTGTSKTVSPSVIPITQQELIAPSKQYAAYVTGKLPTLAADVATLRADIAHGELAKARADWLPAHLVYESLGAAYGAFGDADTAINGLPNGLPKGVNDPGFTGFHRLEYGLWHGQSATTLTPIAAALVTSVAGLQKMLATTEIDPLEFTLRAHEITENALQFELTGETDFGSHTNLATVGANLAGTTTVLSFLKPLLVSRYPALPQTEQALTQATRYVAALHDMPLSQLTRTQREQLDADISGLSELLAPIAEIGEPRRTS